MVYFTADQHFGHANIVRLAKRPFESVEDMDEAMIAAWNGVVAPGDYVYQLGDFTLGGPDQAQSMFARLNGVIRVVPGGHDARWTRQARRDALVSALGDPVSILEPLVSLNTTPPDRLGGRQVVVLCHYAMRVWDRSHYGAWHLYGHSHGSLPGLGRSMDVGVDAVGFAPISLAEVARRLSGIDIPADGRTRRTLAEESGA